MGKRTAGKPRHRAPCRLTCDRPPDWCQRHHVIPWWQGGHTNLDNLTLLCAQHHRQFQSIGWRCVITDGLPYWIPPPWIDPAQKPQHNRHNQPHQPDHPDRPDHPDEPDEPDQPDDS
jgi:HNH endonuclease